MNRTVGFLVALLIVGGVALVLFLNLETGTSGRGGDGASSSTPDDGADEPAEAPAPVGPSGMFREYFIGDGPMERPDEHMEVRAVYFPAVAMAGMNTPTGADDLHLEADVVALAENPNGFAKGQFIPYLKVTYEILPAKGGDPITGELLPMVARDGLHYGANVAMPGPGRYTLRYHFEPPSAGGLGRHADPETGVAAWWKPFDVTWDWDYERPPAPKR